MKYSFIRRNSSAFPVRSMCRVLEVSSAGYYAWFNREPSAADKRREELAGEIRTAHAAVKRRYGSPRMHAELQARGHACSRNTVAKIMKRLGIQAISHKKFRVTTTDSNHDFPVAANVVDRDFTASKPNEVWLSDMTYIPTGEGWLYLAAVEDMYSRRVVGWSMDTTMESRLVVDALEMAVQQRFPDAGLVAHSDRGSQYASEHYQRLLAKQGITCSMSRKGNCYDNAPMESFFATLKKELVHHETYATVSEAKASVFEFIEVFYNRQRRHSSLGNVSPAEFETGKHP
jgi:transposase InsO family protein